MRRLLAVLGLALCFGLLSAGAASAAGGPVNPGTPGAAKGGIDLNPLDSIGGAILNKICPQRQAPYPQAPEQPVVARGGGPGTYAEHGYAGTFWTTYDEGCVSMGKTDTAIAVSIENVATSADSLTNELQMVAQDPKTTSAFDVTIARALKGLHDAFWTPWVGVGCVLVGCLIGLAMATGRLNDLGGHMLRAVLVITLVTGIVSNPALVFRYADAMTAGVSNGVSKSLMSTTPGTSMPASATPSQKFGEAYYQVTNQAWLEGSFCGDADAAKRYGTRLLNAQSFTVGEMKGAAKPSDLAALAKAKQDDWGKIGKEMSQSNPVGFSCWKGASSSRTSAAIKHAVVSIGAGFWVNLGSLALLALRWLLRLAMLFMVTFGAAMMFSQRLADKMVGLGSLALVGPPLVAAGVGTLLWGYYAILLTPGQAWWQAGIMAFALGFAVFMAKGILGSLFTGVSHVGGRAGSYGRRARHSFMNHSRGGSAGGMAAGAVAGAVAGAAVAEHERHAEAISDPGTDSRREQTMEHVERQQVVDSGSDERRTPDPTLGYYMRQAQRTAAAKAEREGLPSPVPAPMEPEPTVVPRYVTNPVRPPQPTGPVTPKPEQRAEPQRVALKDEPEPVRRTVREQHEGLVETRNGQPDAGAGDSRRSDLPS